MSKKPPPTPDPDGSLEQRLAEAIDPGGETRNLIRAFDAVTRVPGVKQWMRSRGVDVNALVTARTGLEASQRVIAEAIRVFAPLGWAPSGAMPLSDYTTALQVLASDGQDAAEQVLVEAWDDGHRLKWAVLQLGNLGKPDRHYQELFQQRAALLTKAYEHHEAGAYEASIPIVLAQIEGFVIDATGGKLFFSRDPNKVADVIDASAIASLHEALPVVREHFSEGMHSTTHSGSLSRHGILHGRELGYATRINSVKAFVLLQALVEWAKPRIMAEAARRDAEREATCIGSDEVDERGRRLDRREFPQTRSALRFAHTCHMGHHRNLGHFRSDLLTIIEDHFTESDGLPTEHGVVMHVSEDGRSWWAYRQTVTGWCLGIGVVGSPDSEWCYDSQEPPPAGPDARPDLWREQRVGNGILPNWKSG